MGFRVVCISRTIAAGGEVVGQVVSQRLGFRYVDEEVVGRAAEKAHVDPRVVAAAEHKQPLIKRLIESLAATQGIPDPSGLMTGVTLAAYYQPGLAPNPLVSEDHRTLIRETIGEIANEGSAVIVAHAASLALTGRNDVLRVLITASPETRAQRLAQAGERDAVAAVAASDRERREYFKGFYNIKEELPTHYDLVINTDVLTPEQAVRLILCIAES
ncbi:MAG TPA: cytidylate kinase-like family protein [Candidatus Acidoferrales bacterium]|nr:cytidylate kinase-like family protein [Candidatus Acidoferrales bacterium]